MLVVVVGRVKGLDRSVYMVCILWHAGDLSTSDCDYYMRTGKSSTVFTLLDF